MIKLALLFNTEWKWPIALWVVVLFFSPHGESTSGISRSSIVYAQPLIRSNAMWVTALVIFVFKNHISAY